MTAVIEPSQLHRCMADRHILHRDFSLRSGWAGWEVATNDSSIIFGPIIPKCASKMIRGLFGARNRPAGLRPIAMGSTPANATRNLSFHFAIVRPPFEHFVAGFAEVGAITIGFTKTAFRNALKSAPGLNWYRSPIQRLIEGAYCNASEHQRLGHFREYVLHFIRARHKDVHTVRQIDWLRDFSAFNGIVYTFLDDYRKAYMYRKATRSADDSERRVKQRRESTDQQRVDRIGHADRKKKKKPFSYV